MIQPTPAILRRSPRALGPRWFAGLLGALLASLPAAAHTTESEPGKVRTPVFALSLVELELEAAAGDAFSLEQVYRGQVRSLAEAAVFFQSTKFLRLRPAEQRRVLDAALALDPTSLLSRLEYLPTHLREEYRRKTVETLQVQVLKGLEAMPIEEQVALYLPSHPGMAGGAGGADAFDPRQQVKRFLRDPGLRQLRALEDAWIVEAAGPFATAETLVEAKVMTARNLSARGLAPSRDSVLRSWTDLEAVRASVAGVELFRARDVVVAAGKIRPDEVWIFGKSTSVEAIRAQEPKSLDLYRSDDKSAHDRLSRAVAESDQLTLLLEMHGRPDALEFAGALKPEELARMFVERRGKGRAIVILNSCFGHDFIRSFAAKLEARGIEPPILIVPEEYGQVTIVGTQENAFTRDDLGLGRRQPRLLGDLWQSERRELAVYVPGVQGLAQLR